MKWKIKDKPKDTSWHKKFIWFWPVKTEDGYKACLQTVWRRYRVHMDSGKYVYRIDLIENTIT